MKMVTYGLLCCLFAVPALAQDSVPLNCPKAGTVIKITTGELKFTGANGIYCNYTDTRGQPASRVHLFAADGTEWGNKMAGKLATLWPLKVGNKLEAHYDAQGGTWYFTWDVERREKVTVPSGTFDSFVIKQTHRGTGGNTFHATRVVWYAPEVGYFVKYDVQIHSGFMRTPDVPWEALEIIQP